MSPLGISLLMLVAFVAFAWLAWRKLAIVVALAPEVRWDHPLARAKSVLTNGFLQARMIRRDWKPGVMHAVIFIGFMTLLVRKIQLILIGYFEPFTYGGIGGGIFAAMKDVVEIAVLAALAYAYWRRFVQKPRRLESNGEALLILTLILAIMITDLAFDGFRFALFAATDPGIAHERTFAFAGSRIAELFAGWPMPAQTAGITSRIGRSWQSSSRSSCDSAYRRAFSHRHRAPGALLSPRRPGEPGSVARPRKDHGRRCGRRNDADRRPHGARPHLEGKAARLTCTECGRCKDACPTFLTGKPLAQKWVHDDLKHHLLEHRKAITGEPAAGASLPALVPGVIGEDRCGPARPAATATAACPIELEHLPRFFRMRQHQVLMEGEFPHALKPVFDAYESQSNPWGLPAPTRGDWARGLGVTTVTTAEQVRSLEYLYYVGSAASFDPRGQKVARAFVEILQQAGVRFGILGAGETSTGECVRRAGNEMLFQTLAQGLVATLNELGVTRIVTSDPHAFNSLKNEYPEFGGRYEVLHHTQLIARLVEAGRIRLQPRFERIIYHEPCYLGRHNGEFAAPRAILRRLSRDEPLEFDLNREKAMCCGAGGGRMWLEESTGRRINILRVEQSLPHAPATIATACPYCAVMMADGVSALEKVGEIATRDIAELVASAMVRESAAAPAPA